MLALWALFSQCRLLEPDTSHTHSTFTEEYCIAEQLLVALACGQWSNRQTVILLHMLSVSAKLPKLSFNSKVEDFNTKLASMSWDMDHKYSHKYYVLLIFISFTGRRKYSLLGCFSLEIGHSISTLIFQFISKNFICLVALLFDCGLDIDFLPALLIYRGFMLMCIAFIGYILFQS